ncbi:hypothetical protein LXL04_037548 [Taraxacum kok-saghyz]
MGVSNLSSDPQFSTTHLLQLAVNGFGSADFISKTSCLRRNLSDSNTTGGVDGGGGDGVNEKKWKSCSGSWDDVDNLSLDGSGLNYDSNDFTVNTTTNFEENGIKINGGNSSNANSTVTGAGGSNQKGKKKGLSAKNLMAMDRALILGDAIEYLKELLQKINDLNYELESAPSSSSLTPTAGLDGDYLRRNFGPVLDIVPLADAITKLTARCEICGKKAHFTFRKTKETKTELIGGADMEEREKKTVK